MLRWCNRRKKQLLQVVPPAFTNCASRGVLASFNITWRRLSAPDAFGLGQVGGMPGTAVKPSEVIQLTIVPSTHRQKG